MKSLSFYIHQLHLSVPLTGYGLRKTKCHFQACGIERCHQLPDILHSLSSHSRAFNYFSIFTLVVFPHFSYPRTKKYFWNGVILEKNWKEQKTEV